jgi:inner membrane protein
MDNLAHTLVGLTLAKGGLEKRSAFATTALVIGANLPDVDGVTYLVSSDLALLIRRGWTHGIAAILVLSLVLASALVLIDRAIGRRSVHFRAIFPLSLLAVATHPLLDWLNPYGMRWLMPFENMWFYGETLFIVDPWMWLVLGGVVFLATSRGIVRMLIWTMLAFGTAFLVWTGPFDSIAGRVLFVTGIAIFALIRLRRPPQTERGLQMLQRGALVFIVFYVLSMMVLSTTARRFTLAEFRERGIEVENLMVGPVPMTPFTKDVVARTPQDYRYGTFLFWPSVRLILAEDAIPRPEPSPVVARALVQPEVRGYANWARFPWAEVIDVPEGYRVILHDMRYATNGNGGFGTSVVVLPRTADRLQ